MAAEYKLSFNDYLFILRRRAVLLAASFAAILTIAIIVAVVVPPVYQSTGTIMVESQQIPTDMIATTATSFVEERIEVIRQRVMTRENLTKIIDRYGLFRDSGASLSVSEKVDEVRRQILIEPIVAAAKGRRAGQGTIAFKLTYEHRHPEVAHKVANELVTLFLDENVKARTARASETTEFLTQEANKLKAELETLENNLAGYKQKFGNSLPEHQQLRMNVVSRTETDLKDVEREHKVAQEELRYLEVELSAAKAGVNPKSGATSSRPVEDLDSLKADYARLSATYKEAHPDVRALKRKIDALEASAPASAKKSAGEVVSLDVARAQAKYDATKGRIDSLAGQIRSLRGKLGSTEQQIIQSPQVERGLLTLMRDHENAQKKYEEIRAKQMSAKIAESLEGENKAERFALLEPPVFPEKPSRPDRGKILLVGLLMAMGGSGGLVYMLETLNQRIRGEEALSVAIRQRTMVVIPYITTEEEVSGRRRLVRWGAAILVVTVVVALILVHFLYMPLDLLFAKILARFG